MNGLRFLLYRTGVKAYETAIRLAAPFHAKARLWRLGRQNWAGRLRAACAGKGPWIWMHAASLGEFEQGRPLLEAIRQHWPQHRILLTFYSPSGYEPRKQTPLADHVCYLPPGGRAAAEKFVDIVQPLSVLWVKYELWLDLLTVLQRRRIPLRLVSASMKADSPFLKGLLSPLYRETLGNFEAIFTQDEQTASLLRSHTRCPRIRCTGDTRYDRVAAGAEGWAPIPEVSAWTGSRFCIVAGSTWPAGERLLLEAFDLLNDPDICLIIAPHDIHPAHISRQLNQRPGISYRFSDGAPFPKEARILWIDNIGMLSRLYGHAHCAYVGGGERGALHNILEAAALGCPLAFGPRYHDKPEAVSLLAEGGATVLSSAREMADWIQKWREQPELRVQLSAANRAWVLRQRGATAAILAAGLSDELDAKAAL